MHWETSWRRHRLRWMCVSVYGLGIRSFLKLSPDWLFSVFPFVWNQTEPNVSAFKDRFWEIYVDTVDEVKEMWCELDEQKYRNKDRWISYEWMKKRTFSLFIYIPVVFVVGCRVLVFWGKTRFFFTEINIIINRIK